MNWNWSADGLTLITKLVSNALSKQIRGGALEAWTFGHRRSAPCPSVSSALHACGGTAPHVAQLILWLAPSRTSRPLCDCSAAHVVINSLMVYRAQRFVYLGLGPSLVWALGHRTPCTSIGPALPTTESATLLILEYSTPVNPGLKVLLKTRSAGDDVPPGISLRRRSSHADRENPRTPAPPIYSGTASPWDGTSTDLYFGVGQMRGFFLTPAWKFAPTGSWTQDLRSATQAI